MWKGGCVASPVHLSPSADFFLNRSKWRGITPIPSLVPLLYCTMPVLTSIFKLFPKLSFPRVDLNKCPLNNLVTLENKISRIKITN